MKKVISVILSLAMILTISTSVFATNGDVVGHIYSTDIRAYINGVEVKSYNIGGKTAVVIEDILKENTHQYIYDDSTRTLKFFSLDTDYLVEGKSESKTAPGRIVGKIYETDIKTSIYDVVIPTYNIGGKTAVAIEDLGYDNAFSPIGGKFIWNEKERTISLEFLYSIWSGISGDKDITISFNETMTEAAATFEEKFHCGGGQEHFEFPNYVTDNTDIEVVVPIKAQDEVIGYYFRRPSNNNKFTAFTYYYPEKVKEAEKIYMPDMDKTREEIIGHFVGAQSVGEPRERFDTDDYSFVYISVAGTSWTSYNLLQVWEDGTYIDYGKEIQMRNRSPQNLVIDKENEKVTFKHVDRYTSEWYTDYEIDLKKGEIKAVENEEVSNTDFEDMYSTFEEVTGLARKDIDHMVIKNIADGVEHTVVDDEVISEIYNTINTDSFFHYSKNGSGGGLKKEIEFYDKNNSSYAYTLGVGVINDKGFFMSSNEEALEKVIEKACDSISNTQ